MRLRVLEQDEPGGGDRQDERKTKIKLVFGTATRGVELPRLTPSFETSQPGIFVIGELSGMGLIRNAMEQGRQAAATIAKSSRRGRRR